MPCSGSASSGAGSSRNRLPYSRPSSSSCSQPRLGGFVGSWPDLLGATGSSGWASSTAPAKKQSGAEARAPVGGGKVEDRAGVGHDVGRDGRHAEEHAARAGSPRPCARSGRASRLVATRYASTPETRKQAEPTRSGVQISRSSCCVERPVCIASKVSRLNSSVPANWIAALHQDGSSPRSETPRRRVAWRSSSARGEGEEAASRRRRSTASAPPPTSCTTPGNGPMKKHSEPTAKPAAIGRSQPASAPGPDARSSA